MEIYTTGVYGLTSEEFFDTLVANKIDTFIDIRKRRAVRGSKFSFVNSKRLQNKLAELDIQYLHILDLAPTNEIREIQYLDDDKSGIKKRDRKELGNSFIYEYKKQILEKFNFLNFIIQLENMKANRVILFCVEREPKACHRSLVAERLAYELSVKPINL